MTIRRSVQRDYGRFAPSPPDSLYVGSQVAAVASHLDTRRHERLWYLRIDDVEQGISHIERGADLLYSTPRQILLKKLLSLPTPRYGHRSIAINAAGGKRSKQVHALPLCSKLSSPPLLAASPFLGQEVPIGLRDATVDEQWQSAFANDSADKVPHAHAVAESFT